MDTKTNTQILVDWINELMAEDKMYKFYKSRAWIELREQVMLEHHHECYKCRAKGKITKADMVHHVNHVTDRPDLALTQYTIDDEGNKVANLIPLCNACHNLEHPEKSFKARNKNKPTTDERWD